MAEHRDEIDLRTLEEVRRVLASTEFASIDDLARRATAGGPSQGAQLTRALSSGARSSTAPAGNSEGLAPLPKRR